MNSEEMDIVNNLNSSNYLLKITDKNYFPQILIEFEPTNITNNHLQYAGTWFLLALVNTILLFNKGINSFALKIGPAINCGK